MDAKVWLEVYQILVEECGAPEHHASEFFYDQANDKVDQFPGEWRFMGALGMGGKFYRSQRDERWYVSCYPEHKTPERLAMIQHANKRLAELHQLATD